MLNVKSGKVDNNILCYCCLFHKPMKIEHLDTGKDWENLTYLISTMLAFFIKFL